MQFVIFFYKTMLILMKSLIIVLISASDISDFMHAYLAANLA